MRKAEERLAELAREHGVEVAGTTDKSRQMYGRLSEAGHNDRAWLEDSILAPERLMATGPHPDAVRRAGYVGWIGTVVEETAISVGISLAVLFPEGFYDRNVKPLLEAIEAIRRACPIPD